LKGGKKMAKEKTITLLVTGAVGILLMVALISSLADESNKRTSLTVASNEVIDISPARLAGGAINETYPFTITHSNTGWKTETSDCNIQALNYGNTSTTWTATTDYSVSTAGILTLVNTDAVNQTSTNSTRLTYKYCADDYLNSSWGRTLLNTNVGLIAVAILVVAIVVAYQLLNKEKED